MTFAVMRKGKVMDDVISRAAAIYAIVNTVSDIRLHDNSETARYGATYRQQEIITILKSLPSAQPERMRGRWQEITASDCSGYDPVLAGYDDPVVGYVCSVCHEGYEKEVMGKTAWDYCPNCGSYNGGENHDKG